MIHVLFTDGEKRSFDDVGEAEHEIEESVIGCDYAVMVESVEDDDGNSYGCDWSVKLRKL
jgi:hypothetical protein